MNPLSAQRTGERSRRSCPVYPTIRFLNPCNCLTTACRIRNPGYRGIREGCEKKIVWHNNQRGFKTILMEIWEPIADALESVRCLHCFYTGHSLGGALATLAASLFDRRAPSTPLAHPAWVTPPSAGTLSDIPVFNICNPRDIVTALPPAGRWTTVYPCRNQHRERPRFFCPAAPSPRPRRFWPATPH